MKKKSTAATVYRSKRVYVGFIDDHPHVFIDDLGYRVVAVYVNQHAAKACYEDVRTAKLVVARTPR